MVLGSDLGRSRGTALAAAVVFVLAPALAACSDDGGGGGGAATATATATVGGAATAPTDAAAAEQRVRRNWQKFFDPATSAADKQALLENGRMMGPMLRAFNGDRRGGQVAAEVEKVTFTSPTEATVTYTLTLNGATALPDATGKAVLQDGTWKVSVTTLCALVALSGDASASAVPGC
ncbi:hypothetical protein [Streptomyces sp. NBC_00582]|uniref:hypothetical protein n=1 Tax=Streptomyces sp. NBC_00582 TaxID=2975783 RepID=UPI0010EB93E3|nr:hypothetical protein [Streptomyces sp. NBC_00582]WUB65726.1 hypothetical protein OG852_37555 [Streptomyces sp. NBC_00582]